jgi:Family of unknown function (DUF6353)
MKSPLFVSRGIGSTKFFLSKNGPTLLTAGGVAGFVATTALTVRATMKAQERLPEIKREIEKTKHDVKSMNTTDRERVRIMSEQYGKVTIELTKIYWPVLVTGSASIVCVLAGHNIMLKRQASLAAAYTALDTSYKIYRKRVAEKIGEDEERALYSGLPPCATDDEGNPCEILDAEDILPSPSPYARFFDETSRNWTKTPEYNLFFLRSQENFANDRLNARGYLFLNEVYEALGLSWSQAGQVVGWRKPGNGDNHVDFGIYQIGDESNRAFVNGVEATILLDFNVDGIIRI